MISASYRLGLQAITKGGPYLVLAGLPGLARLGMLSGLAVTLGLEGAGTISSDLSLLYFLGFATSAGWATRLISRGTSTKPSDDSRLVSHVAGSGLTALLFFPILVVLPITHLAPVGMMAMLIGHGTYQNVRGAAVAARRWKAAALYDMAVHLVPFAAFVVAPRDSEATFLAVMTLTMIIGGFAISALPVGGAPRLLSFPSGGSIVADMQREAPKSILLGLAMLVTTGMMFSFVPLVLRVGSAAEASIVALLVNSLAALALLPRALTYRYLPLIGDELAGSSSHDGSSLNAFIRNSRLLGLSIAAVGMAMLGTTAWTLDGPSLCLVAGLIIGAIVPILVTGEVHYLVVTGRSREILLVNLATSVPYLASFFALASNVIVDADDSKLVILVSIAFMFGAVLRSAWFWRMFSRRVNMQCAQAK